jgi:tetratricopeptide (TPR) repeat protein
MRRSFVFRAAVVLATAALSTACGSTGTGQGASAPSHTAEQQLSFGVDMARRGLWSEALFRFHQAEELAPGSARIQNNLAVAYEATGEFDQALQHYQSALKLEPNNRDLRANWTRFSQFYSAFTSQKRAQGAPGATPAGQTGQPRPAPPTTAGGQQPEIPSPGSIRPAPAPVQPPTSDPSSPPASPPSSPAPF